MVRDLENWPDMTTFPTRLEDVSDFSERAVFYRERDSHKGIRKFAGLRKFQARMVNQDFLEEICELEELIFLSLEGVTATDFRPLSKLTNLRVLKISNANKVTDFNTLSTITSLRGLYLENVKNLNSVNFLSQSDHLLRIGVEGSMWKRQKVETLAPFKSLKSLQELFLTNVILLDKDLTYLAECPKLEVLECARFAAKRNFERLRELMPKLSCQWCDQYEINLSNK